MFDGGGISLDFAGTSPPVDRGINVPFCYTRAMACYAVKCLTVPGMPNNEGAVAPIQVSAPLTAFCVAPQSESPARGLFGGGDGSRRTILIDGRAVHPKGAHTVAPGQRFTMRDAGGGGFGEPANRPRAKILADVGEGLVTLASRARSTASKSLRDIARKSLRPPSCGGQVVRSRHRQSAVSGQSDENSVVAAMEGGTVARSCAV